MNKLILIFIVIFITIPFISQSQSCFPEGIIFTTQEQIDNFQFNYPECTVIEGPVRIEGNDITSISELIVLTLFLDDLTVINNPSLTSLDGLENITSIGGSLTVDNNNSLTNIEGLENLISIGNDIIISNNMSLINLSGLERVTEIVGVDISENMSLTSLLGLENINSIEGQLIIYDNDELTNLTGLNNLTFIGNYLYISYNYNLINLIGLENLTSIGNLGLHIEDNDHLTSLNGLNGLTSLSEIFLYNNVNLTSLSGLENVTTIEGSLIITYNVSLNNIEDLQNLNSIGNGFYIEGSDSLSSLVGLENITTLKDLEISYNGSLTSLTGMDNLTSVNGYGVQIIGNESLNSLSSLENITSIGEVLIIWGNSSLMSLTGLENINDGSPVEELTIIHNINLSMCEVQSVCNYLADPTVGDIEIHDNATGCNTVEEVEEACTTCLTEGISFTTQSEIDNFQNNYPDCNHIEGNVIINGNGITNLNGLIVLYSIGGTFMVNNTVVTNLSGLGNLSSIGGELQIVGNDNLNSISELSNVTSIGETLFIGHPIIDIWGNNILNSLTGLEQLTTIGGDVVIGENDALTSLTGLEQLTTIEGDLIIGDNNDLIDLTGLNNLINVVDLIIWGNDDLTSLTGLEQLATIGGHLDIYYNDLLNNLMSLNNITNIGGKLDIYDNNSLTSLSGLDNVTTIEGDLIISNNDVLSDLMSINNVTSIGGSLEVEDNDILTSLTGLDNIEEGSIIDLEIRDNISLSICNIENICQYLISPNGTVTIYNNSDGCNSQEEISPPIDIFISDTSYCYSTTLIATEGFENYLWNTGETTSSIEIFNGGYYSVIGTNVSSCPVQKEINVNYYPPNPYEHEQICMVTLSQEIEKNVIVVEKTIGVGIDSIQFYRQNNSTGLYDLIGSIGINDESTFTDMGSTPNELSQRYKIAIIDTCENRSNLSVEHRTMLLQSSTGVNNEVNLSWNPYEGFSYQSFEIYRSLNEGEFVLLAYVPFNTYSYTDFNPPNVNKKYQIRIEKDIPCDPTKKEYQYASSNINQVNPNSIIENGLIKFRLYPNPFSKIITLEYELKQTKKVSLTIYDQIGRQVYQSQENQLQGKQQIIWNSEGFPDGIYYYRIQVGEQTSNGNIAKLRLFL